MTEDSADGLDRRTFMKGVGLTAGAATLGLGATGTAAAGHDGFDRSYANWRVREASKVWERGYRGRRDRPLGITDSGVDALHPDLGPWNGVRVEDTSDSFELVEDTFEEIDGSAVDTTVSLGAGALSSSTATTDPIPVPADTDRMRVGAVDAGLAENVRVAILDDDGEELAANDGLLADYIGLATAVSRSGTETVQILVEATDSTGADVTVRVRFYDNVAGGSTGEALNEERNVLDSIDDAAIPREDAKTLAWYGTPRYGQFAKARDGNGHGTHVSSIMAGSGRASTVENVEEDAPRTILAPTDVVEYTVDAKAGTGVFASAYGDGLSVRIEDPEGETVAHSKLFGGGPHAFDSSLIDSNIATSATTHDADAEFADEAGRATYHVFVTASDEEETGTPLVARLERIAVGSYLDPSATDGDADDDGPPDTVQAGVSPDAGIVGVQGLGDGLAAFAKDPGFWTETFGVRSVNMSWGTVGGLPFGNFGGALEESTFGENSPALLKRMAEGGLLTVAAAGNSFTPANGNSAPAVADEAISVAATDALDGLSGFSSGGAPAIDEDDDGEYVKPDVTAPGGRAPTYPASIAAAPIYDDVVAAKNGIPEVAGERRNYTGKIGTSMASPYVNGVAGLLANAMEFGPAGRPEELTLPEPTETGLADVLRWKSILLATASETAFTAAPYHYGQTIVHAPTYQHGGRDPYEGYGRVNPDAAIDAVTRDLTGETLDGEVGLNIPEDSRAVAGYVTGTGTFEVSLDYSHLSGGNKGMAKGAPHLDLFVYDPAAASAAGDPAMVASAMGTEGDASVTFSTPAEGGAYIVAAKLVNVPGVVNGFDVQANVSLSVDQVSDLVVTGTRTDDGFAHQGGRTNEVEIEVDASDAVLIRDRVPKEWDVNTEFSPVRVVPGTQFDYVYYDADGDGDADGDDASETHSFSYLVEAPDSTGTYDFGPVEATTDPNAGLQDDSWVSIAGTSSTEYVGGGGA